MLDIEPFTAVYDALAPTPPPPVKIKSPDGREQLKPLPSAAY